MAPAKHQKTVSTVLFYTFHCPMTSSHSRFPIFIAYYYLIHTFADSTMRFDSGFDMVPRLGTSMSDTSKWAHFIDQVKFRYRGDPKVELKWNYMLFKAGAHLLLLPFEGHRFLRFSSMVSAGIGDPTEAKQCISTVSHIAQLCVWRPNQVLGRVHRPEWGIRLEPSPRSNQILRQGRSWP